jgi:hypothetical protein
MADEEKEIHSVVSTESATSRYNALALALALVLGSLALSLQV